MPITPLFAAIFALMYVYLSFAVIKHRIGKQVGLGEGEDRDLLVAIRTHANFSEYVPFALILMWFLETVAYNSTLALVLGCVLLLGRVSHIIGLRNPKQYMVLRQAGILATFGVLTVSSVYLIWHYLPV